MVTNISAGMAGSMGGQMQVMSMLAGGLNPLAVCKNQVAQFVGAGETSVDDGAISDAPEFVSKTAPKAKKLFLRLCVHSAADLSGDITGRCDPYVNAAIQGGPSWDSKAESSVSPVWEEVWEQEYTTGESSSIMLKVLDKDIVGSRLLGIVQISLPTGVTSPKKETLKLRNVPKGYFSVPPKSTLTILFHSVESLENQPNLVEIGDMDEAAMELQNFTISCEIRKLRLRKPTSKVSSFSIQCSIENPVSEGKMKMQQSKTSPEISMSANHRTCEWDRGTEDGWPCLFNFSASRVDLMSRMLSITLIEQREGMKNTVVKATWREIVTALCDTVSEHNEARLAWVQLRDHIGAPVGKVLIELDMFDNEMRHNLMAPPADGDLLKLDVLRGAPSIAELNKPIEYYCFLYGDCFPALDRGGIFGSNEIAQNRCDPFVRLSMDGAKARSKTKSNMQRKVFWTEPVVVRTKVGSRRVKVQIYNDNSFIPMIASEELVGEATIFHVLPGKNQWVHFYGGSIKPKYPDISQSMIKGGILPPSTYRGSVCMHFSTKQNVSKKLWPPHKPVERAYTTICLTVRMYRGVYLHQKKPDAGDPPMKVNVLVQLASAGLPVKLPKKVMDKLPRFNMDSQGENSAIAPRNLDILTFPGEVDDNGLLSFKDWADPVGTKKAMYERDSLSLSLVCACRGDNDPYMHGLVEEDVLLWVERRSEPVQVLPGVKSAYVYIQYEDDEAEPVLFSVLTLPRPTPDPTSKTDDDDEEADGPLVGQKPGTDDKCDPMVPTWNQIYWDRSLIEIKDPACIEKGEAGRLLCSINWERECDKADYESSFQPEIEPIDAHEIDFDMGNADAPTEQSSGSKSGLISRRPPTHALIPETVLTSKCRANPSMVRIGSPGNLVTPCYVSMGDVYTLYCHVDILAAKNLPAMDEDGLSDPCWRILVEEKTVECIDVPKTLDPVYLQRVVIPVKLVLPKKSNGQGPIEEKNTRSILSEKLHVPLPPVYLKLLDRDEGTGLFADTFSEIGSVVCENPTNLDARSLEIVEQGKKMGLLYLDDAHDAMSVALDGDNKAVPFAEVDTRKGWSKRPQVIWAVGYSLQPGAHMAERYRVAVQPGKFVDDPYVVDNAARKDADQTSGKTFSPGDVFEFEYATTSREYGKVKGDDGWVPLTLFRTFEASNLSTPLSIGNQGIIGQNLSEEEMKEVRDVNVEKDRWRPAGPFRIQTGQYSYFRIQMDLLGLRNVSDEVTGSASMRVRSFFKSTVDLPVEDRELPNPNFRGVLPTDWTMFRDELKELGGFMRLVESVENMQEDEREEAESDDASSVATDVGMDEFVGMRINCPIYRAPIIGYLQRNAKGMVPEPEMESGNQLVLLPDVNFQLRNESGLLNLGLQSLELGSLSLSLQDFRDFNTPMTWFEEAARNMAKLPERLRDQQIMPLKKFIVKDNATKVFIDSFARKEGDLTYDNDVRMGRSIQEMSLYDIEYKTYRTGFKEVKKHSEFLNETDYFLNNPDPSFLSKVHTRFPVYTVDRSNTEPIPFEETIKSFVVFLEAKGKIRPVPFNVNPMDCPYYLELAKTFLKGMRDPQSECHLGRWPTGQYSRLCDAYGWRFQSSRTAPVQYLNPFLAFKIPPPKKAESTEDRKASKNIEDVQWEHRLRVNHHTFMRPVGHVIKGGEGGKKLDDRFLARMQIKEISYYNDEAFDLYSVKKQAEILLEKRKDGDCDTRLTGSISPRKAHVTLTATNNFLNIKWANPDSLQSVVIYTVPEKKHTFRDPGEVLMILKVEEGDDCGAYIVILTPSLDLRFPMEQSYYVRKNVVERWRTLQDSIDEKKKAAEENISPTQDKKLASSHKLKAVTVNIEEADTAPLGLLLSDSDPPKIKKITDRHSFWDDNNVVLKAIVLSANGKTDRERLLQELERRPLELEISLKPRKKSYRESNVYAFMFRTKKASAETSGRMAANIQAAKSNRQKDAFEKTPGKKTGANGYTRPVKVQEGEFVLRCARRVGSAAFDRPQCHNWWAKVTLQDGLFPELHAAFEKRELEPNDEQAWKRKALENTYNLCLPLKSGEGETVATLKGNLRLIPVGEDAQVTILVQKRDEGRDASYPAFLSGKYVYRDTYDGRNRYEKMTERKVVMLEYVKKAGIGDGWAFCVPDDEKAPYFADKSSMAWSVTEAKWTGLHISTSKRPHESETVNTPLPLPVRQFWQVDTVIVHVYVLTARNLSSVDLISQSEPYLLLETSCASVTGEQIQEGDNQDPNFYEHFQIAAQLPGATTLKIKVMAKGTLSDSLIGEVAVDLEDRWMCMKQRTFRAIASEFFVEERASKGAERSLASINLGCKTKDAFCKARLPPVSPAGSMPIEFKTLKRSDPSTNVDLMAGHIRFWIDMVPGDDSNYLPAVIEDIVKPGEFELRVVVWSVRDIGIFKDSGQRNDLLIKGKLTTKDLSGRKSVEKRETDVHKFSNTTGTFNWRWKFPIHLPIKTASLVLSLMDQDTLTADDPIYKSKELPLDHLIRLAYQNWRDNPTDILGPASQVIVFDEYADRENMPQKCCVPFCCVCKCCWRGFVRQQKPSEAKLLIEIQCVSKDYATHHPAGEGREGPEPLPTPTDRVDWGTFLTAPGKMVKVLLGPDRYRICAWACCCVGVMMFAMTIMGLLFLCANIFPEKDNPFR
eukprot:GEMP01000120.1.p1 GENE.GEMP01000120.1~~GEMP01000120.1.p1  ORF type:complete len:2655 (+),score=533.33 GEMP01000120.1:60-8024(+)